MRRPAASASLCAFAVALAPSLLSCRQVAGIHDNPPTDLATTLCGLPYGTTTCASCAYTNCCSESEACAADPIFCSPYESCLGACNGEPACRSRCTIDHPVPPDNAAPVSALSTCLASNCETECGLACGGFAAYLSEPDASTACQSCFAQSNACSNARRCGSSPDCDALWRCYLTCATPDCQATCVSEHDAGAALFRPLYGDFSGTCAGACGYGGYWACVGHVTWPRSSTTVTGTFWAYDFQSGSGVPGASVQFCTACPCPTPQNRVLADGGTDSNGYVTLQFQQDISTTGQATIGCLQASASGYLTTFGYGDYPFTEPSWSVDDTLLPRVSWGIALQTPAALAADLAAQGVAFDATLAAVGVATFDCLGSPASGVEVSIAAPPLTANGPIDGGPTSPSIGVYGVDAGPDGSITASSVAGRVYFLNVPAGSVTLTATVPGVGVVSQVSVTTAPDTVTAPVMPPTPIPH